MADALFAHDPSTLVNRSVRRHRGDAQGHDLAYSGALRSPALKLALASVVALRKDSNKLRAVHDKYRTDVLLRQNLARSLDCAVRRDQKETKLFLHIEQLLRRFRRFVHRDSPSISLAR